MRPEAWEVIKQMAEKGGWTEETKSSRRAKRGKDETSSTEKRKNEGTATDTDTRRRSKRRTGVKS